MKRLFLVLMAELCSACPLSAAIITERNDVFSFFPESAVFRGTSAAPGIESQWIPYGTYTGGNGGTEYLRVTSNLVGVVASVFDGYWERYNIGVNSSTNIRDFAYGELWTNDTRRILDYINATRSPLVHGDWQGIRTNDYARECIEERLCPTSGLFAVAFGSRALDALAVNVDPPIPTSWTAAIPFSAADADDWATVWPTYYAVTNDTHFLTDPHRTPWRNHVSSFLYLGDFAGRDYSEARDDLFDALADRFVPVSIPDVLAYDTGLKYPNGIPTNDYWMVNGQKMSLHYDEKDDYGWFFKRWWSDELFEDEYGEYELNIVYDNGTYPNWTFYKYYFGYNPYLERLWEGQDEGNLDFMDGYDLRTGQDYVAYRILQYDDTDDFAHWRNMTRRLDWKRLGIICQLERQMETTYYPRGSDDLPLVAEYAEVGNTYSGTLHVAYTIAQDPDPDTGAWPVTWDGSLSGVSWQRENSSREVTTNFQGMSFPVAAAGQPLLSASILYDSEMLGYFDIDTEFFENACLDFVDGSDVGDFEDGTYRMHVSGTMHYSGRMASVSLHSAYILDGPHDVGTYGYYPVASWLIERNGSADFSLWLWEKKTSHAYYTLSDALSARSNLVESITLNDLFFWDNQWIASRVLPTFEMMIAATNCADLVDVTYSEGSPVEMSWDNLAPSNGPRRAFRMSPEPTTAESRVALMNSRVAILLGLDREVKSRFASLAGQRVTTIASASANLTPSESAELRAELERQHPPMHLTVSAFGHDRGDSRIDFVASGTVVISSGEVVGIWIEGVYDDDYGVSVVDGAYRFGNWGIVFDGAGAGMTATNCPPVRVDGHQSQVLKTLWRYKNLRDPNL